MSRDIRFMVVRRERMAITTVAFVHATVCDDFNDSAHTSDAGSVQGAVMSAVTDWINETDEGRNAWESSCEDFNIGDLGENLDSQLLRARLKRYGIEDLEIDIVDGSASNWMFDEVLANTPDLD